jgi:hypothetical protein
MRFYFQKQFLSYLSVLSFLLIANTAFATPTVSILFSQGTATAKPVVIMNHGEPQSRYFKKGVFWIPQKGTLQIILKDVGDQKTFQNPKWQLITEEKKIAPALGFSVSFSVDLKKAFSLQLTEGGKASKTQIKWSFQPAHLPWIKIIKPTHDSIIPFRKKIRFIANAGDSRGIVPQILWIIRHKNRDRLLGLGDELITRNFDIGFNEIRAIAVDSLGQRIESKPVAVIISYKAIKTKIITPSKKAKYSLHQPILFFAEGNKLEYSLDKSPFKMGSGFIKHSLQPGKHTIVFRGQFGTTTRVFQIGKAKEMVATVNRVKGIVLWSAGDGKWKPVANGMSIPVNHIVKTSENGFIELVLKNGVIYILKANKSIRLLPESKIVAYLAQEELEIYSITHPQKIEQAIKQLKPVVQELKQLLKNYTVKEITSQSTKDVNRLINSIANGNLSVNDLKID